MTLLHVGKPVGNADLDAIREVAATMPFGTEDVRMAALMLSTYRENANRTLAEIAAELQRRADDLAANGMMPSLFAVWRMWDDMHPEHEEAPS